MISYKHITNSYIRNYKVRRFGLYNSVITTNKCQVAKMALEENCKFGYHALKICNFSTTIYNQ
jgi:hypothetical protein